MAELIYPFRVDGPVRVHVIDDGILGEDVVVRG
jgi:hypothetical protein